jgi:hypothetical protein
MINELLPEKYREQVQGVLECYDRIVITGHLFPLCYAQGATNYLYGQKVRIFDYAHFAEPLRDEIKATITGVAAANGLDIEFVGKKTGRKEDRIQTILTKRGQQPGVVHIFAAMEGCQTYKPWYDQASGKSYLKAAESKCLHYYVYFIDEDLGLCYLRIPTWCPFRLQFYCNGHGWLAQQLKQHDLTFELLDNAFVSLADLERANQLATEFNIQAWHVKLDELAQRYCPVVKRLNLTYQWSIMQAEFATDLIFKSPEHLQAIYPYLLETLIHAVKPADIATFLGRKLHGNYQGEVGTRLSQVRWLGRRIKYRLGPVSLKMYDKFGLILRIETTVNDVSFFQQYRTVHHRNGQSSKQWATMPKSIYSLPALRECLTAANQRYLKFIAALETPEVGQQRLQHLTETKTDHQHRYKGFNLLAEEDAALLRALLQGELVVTGLTNQALRQALPGKNSGQISRLLKRLRVHGLLKKVGQHYKYHLTNLGRQVAMMALKLRELVVIPTLAQDSSLPA